MSFFPRSIIAEPNSSSLTPFFRFLDDFESYNNPSRTHDHNTHGHTQRTSHTMATFNPKFDIREVADAYELHGELPGIDQKHIDIEFTDAQTLRISGRIERSYKSSVPRLASPESSKALPGTENPDAPSSASESSKPKPHKASVQDEDEDGQESAENGTESKEVKDVTTENQTKSGEVSLKTKEQSKEPEAKMWVSERSIGEFSRTFTFPVRVDQDSVKASMENGILSITVPKLKKHQSRKITIT